MWTAHGPELRNLPKGRAGGMHWRDGPLCPLYSEADEHPSPVEQPAPHRNTNQHHETHQYADANDHLDSNDHFDSNDDRDAPK